MDWKKLEPKLLGILLGATVGAAILFGSLVGCGACIDDGDVKGAVSKQGYKDVVIKDKHIVAVSWRGCSDSDEAAYKVTATNANGQRVDLIVCAGWPFKGVTIRTK